MVSKMFWPHQSAARKELLNSCQPVVDEKKKNYVEENLKLEVGMFHVQEAKLNERRRASLEGSSKG